MIRRATLLALLVAAPAEALDCPAAVPLLFPGDAAAIASATRPTYRRCSVARAGNGSDAPWIAAAVRGHDRLAVALLRTGADGSVRAVATPVEIEALTTEPFHSVAVEVLPPDRLGPGTVAVNVTNGYGSTARSTFTTALHLFRRGEETLVPVFAAYVAANHAGNGRCPGGSAAPDRTCRVEWSRQRRVEAVRGTGSAPPDLVVRDARTRRIVSRHRWAGEAYAPPVFDGLPSFRED